jgi:hypothetical protein
VLFAEYNWDNDNNNSTPARNENAYLKRRDGLEMLA